MFLASSASPSPLHCRVPCPPTQPPFLLLPLAFSCSDVSWIKSLDSSVSPSPLNHRAPCTPAEPTSLPPPSPNPSDVSGLKGLRCLTAVGWIFSIFCTYTGFALMMASVVWSTRLFTKIRRAW